jgi:membrane protease YdiL (CAAX protease family)
MEFSDFESPGPKAAAPAPRWSFFREVPWRWSDVLIGFAPMIAMNLAALLIDPTRLPVGPGWLWLPLTVLVQAWWLAYPLWIARRRHGGSPLLPRPRTVIVEALLAMAAVPVVMLILAGVFTGLAYLIGDSAMPTRPLEPYARSPHQFDWIGLIILAVTVAPIAEEVFFRGMLYSALRRRLPLIVAAPIQAVLFGLVHPFGLADRAGVVLIGLALAVFYEWRKTLLAPMLLHAMINAAAMAVMFAGIAADADAPRLGVYGERQEGGCRITEVVPGSGAADAGLQVGDVVTAMDDQPVADIGDMARIVRGKRLGDNVSIVFLRGGTAYQVEAVLKPLPR